MSSTTNMVNMRVTANSSQGHRKYMEDCYKIRFQRDTNPNMTTMPTTTTTTASNTTNHPPPLDPNNNNQSDILFSFFGIFDGHGGSQASHYCKQHLYWSIIQQDAFWSNEPAKVLAAIKSGFVTCHNDMWTQLPTWPRTASGLPSTSGTTATIVFIKGSRVFVGHVGDSGLVVGITSSKKRGGGDGGGELLWEGRKMTRDHKPEDPIELKRIQGVGGAVQTKSGVNRVVWNRPVWSSQTNNAGNNFKVH